MGLWRAGAAGAGSQERGVGTGGLLGGTGRCAGKSGPVKSGFIFPILPRGLSIGKSNGLILLANPPGPKIVPRICRC